MASLYQSLIFGSVTRALGANKPVRLMHTRVKIDEIKDLAQYNRTQSEDATTPAQLVTKLILNASCLNSGREFLFTAAEVGDPQLGFIRMDEARVVTDCKRLLAEVPKPGIDLAVNHFDAWPAREDEKTARSAIRNQKAAIRWFLDTEAARLAGASTKKRVSLMPARQTVHTSATDGAGLDPTASAANARAFLGYVDKSIKYCNGGQCDAISVNENTYLGFTAVVRYAQVSGGNLMDVTKDSFDRQILTYQGIPLVDVGLKADLTTEIISDTEADVTNAATSTSA